MIAAVLLVLGIASPVAAQAPQYPPAPAPWTGGYSTPPVVIPPRPAMAGELALKLGAVVDALGFADLGAGLIMAAVPGVAWVGQVNTMAGAGLIAIGSITTTSAFSFRNASYVRAGFVPTKKPMIASWILTSTAVAASAITIAMATLAFKQDSLDFFIGGAVCGAVTLVLEAVNVGVRHTAWKRALGTAPWRPRPVFYPAFYPTSSGGNEWAAGVAGTF